MNKSLFELLEESQKRKASLEALIATQSDVEVIADLRLRLRDVEVAIAGLREEILKEIAKRVLVTVMALALIVAISIAFSSKAQAIDFDSSEITTEDVDATDLSGDDDLDDVTADEIFE